MDAFQLLEEAGKVSPAPDAAVDAAVDLVLTAASREGSSSAPAPSLIRRRALRHRRIAFGAVTSTVAVALGAAAFLALAPTGSSRLPGTTAGLSAVQGCPGEYATAGTLKQVSGTRLTLREANATGNVTVATDASTVITIPATGTVRDITDGSTVLVQGTWSGRSLAATQVTIHAGPLGPAAAKAPPRLPDHRGHHPSLSPASGTPRLVSGTAEDVHDGSFTLILRGPVPGGQRIDVVTSNSTVVKTDAKVSLSRLPLGADVVAAGPQHNGVITAGSVTEPPGGHLVLPPGPIKIRSHGCSASAITAAAIMAGS
jgi:hypothetical protein